jgi:hypothetical protein
MHRLEEALLTPAIAGEMPGWISSVEQAAATLTVDWTTHLHSVSHVQYREIAASDPEQLPRIEKMIETEEQLLGELTRFHEELHTLAGQATEVGWHESKLAGRRQHMEEAGLHLLQQIKKQKLAGETWLAEALYRDRGTQD